MDIDFSSKILSCLSQLNKNQVFTSSQKTLLKSAFFKNPDSFIATFRVLKITNDIEDFCDTLIHIVPSNALISSNDLKHLAEYFLSNQSLNQQNSIENRHSLLSKEQKAMFEKQNDFHQLNKQLVCNNGAYDQRMVNNVFANENLINASKETTFVLPNENLKNNALMVADLNSFSPTSTIPFSSFDKVNVDQQQQTDLTTNKFGPTTNIPFSTFSSKQIAEQNAAEERRQQLELQSKTTGVVIEASPVSHSTVDASSQEINAVMQFLNQTRKCLSPMDYSQFLSILEEHQRFSDSTINDTFQRLCEILSAAKRDELIDALSLLLPKPRADAHSSIIMHAPPAASRADIQENDGSQLVRLLATSKDKFGAELFAMPNQSSPIEVVGGLTNDNNRTSGQARQRAIGQMVEQVQGGGATLRADAVALVEAALQFDRGVDRRFLDIMKEFLSGNLDRAGVVSRYNALFSDSMVSPAEGAPMKAVFTTIRSRAQGQ